MSIPTRCYNRHTRVSKKQLSALLTDALNEPVFLTIDGERRKITKREAVVHQLVDKSTSADLRATKMLFDMMKDAEHKAGVAAPPPEPRRLSAADKEVVQLFVERLRRQILAEMAENGETAGSIGERPDDA